MAKMKKQPVIVRESDGVIGALTYFHFILDMLEEPRRQGKLRQADLEVEIEKTYAKEWGPADLRLKKVFKTAWQTIWRNRVDWAKGMGKKQGLFFNNHYIENKKKVTWIISPHFCEEADWVAWAQNKKPMRSFRQRCKKCKFWSSMSDKVCANKDCKHPFPKPVKTRNLIHKSPAP